MPGFQEIFILLAVGFLIFFIPRILRKPDKAESGRKELLVISWKIRLLIVISIIWPFSSALYFKVWENNFVEFLEFGVLPVVAVWGIYWVLNGFGSKA